MFSGTHSTVYDVHCLNMLSTLAISFFEHGICTYICGQGFCTHVCLVRLAGRISFLLASGLLLAS